MKFEVAHRTYTHNVLFALLAGIVFALLFNYANISWHLGFISGFIGNLSHLLGDAFTYMKFKPLWPFSPKRSCVRSFPILKSNCKQVFINSRRNCYCSILDIEKLKHAWFVNISTSSLAQSSNHTYSNQDYVIKKGSLLPLSL